MSIEESEELKNSKDNGKYNSADILLRPMKFNEYIGQEKIKKNLQTMITAAKERNEQLDHLLFFGQAGLGKTTLAGIVANNMGARIRITSGPVLEKTGDLAAILSALDSGDILFIDEAHRINRSIEEMLYPAMESRELHLIIGKGPAARMITIDLPPFTLIAATTRVNLLSSPLRSRFGGIFKLEYYSIEDMSRIIKRASKILGFEIDNEAVEIIARASRFTPRISNRLLKRVRDVAQISEKKKISANSVKIALEMLDIDFAGLEKHDRKLINTIIRKFKGGPVGLSTLSAALGEDKSDIEDVYEPYLLKIGLIQRTSRGRVATEMAYKHLGIKNGKML